MSDPFKVLYDPLPESVSGRPYSGIIGSGDSELKRFIGDHLSISEKTEVENEFKKTFPLHKQRVGKIKKPQPRLIIEICGETLGLYDVPESIFCERGAKLGANLVLVNGKKLRLL
jgi:hypothetical protein